MTGSPADEDYATLSGYWEGWEDDGNRQSATACCPRETIPDSCSCLDGCACLCADCDCDDMAEFFDQWPELPAATSEPPASTGEAAISEEKP